MGQAPLHLRQALHGPPARPAGAGHQDAAFFGQKMIVRRVASPEPVKKRLEALRHVGPVDGADPYDAVGILQRLIDFPKIIPDHAGAVCPAGAPAVSAGAAVFELFAVQMDFFDFDSRVGQSFHELIFRGGRQPVRVGA